MLIWNKSLGSVKHQVVDWCSFSSNRWLKHFMTNGRGTIASQTIFQLLLIYIITAAPPTREAPTAAHLSQGPTAPKRRGGSRPQQPPWCSPIIPCSGSERKSSTCRFRGETWETLAVEKSYKVQPMPHMLKYSIFKLLLPA